MEWNDARIGEQIGQLWARLNELDRTNERLALLERGVAELAEDQRIGLADCRDAVKTLTDAFALRAAAREAERRERERDRKTDRRWLIGAILTSAGLVVAAMAVLIPLLVTGTG